MGVLALYRAGRQSGDNASLRDWNQVSLLAVESSQLRRWYQPGLLLIGDAAHTMSSIGAVGITIAIQDATEVSNLLGPRLRAGRVSVADLAAVQRRRELPVRIVQAYQLLMQRWMLAPGDDAGRMPLGYRVQQRIPFLRNLGARIFGLGVWPVRLSPAPTPRAPEVTPLPMRTLFGTTPATEDACNEAILRADRWQEPLKDVTTG